MTNTKTIANIHEQLVQMSSLYGIAQIEIALKEYLEELEQDKQDALIAEQSWNTFVAEGKQGRPLSELVKELDA